MAVLSKFDLNEIKFLDTEKGEYNLGTVPNYLIDKFLHQLSYIEVKHQIIGRYRHRQLWQNVLDELYNNECDDLFNVQDAHNWFVETYGTYEENPRAYDFYNDLVYGV